MFSNIRDFALRSAFLAVYLLVSPLTKAAPTPQHAALVEKMNLLIAPVLKAHGEEVISWRFVDTTEVSIRKYNGTLTISLPPSIFTATENLDTILFFVFQKYFESTLTQSKSAQISVESTRMAFKVLVESLKLNPRAPLAYIKKAAADPSVDFYTQEELSSITTTLNLSLVDWIRAQGEGADFRVNADAFSPLTAPEIRTLRSYQYREIHRIITNPKIHIREYLESIKTNSGIYVSSYFSSDLELAITELRIASRNLLSQEKLVESELRLYKNLNAKYDALILEILGSQFEISSAQQFFALRALTFRQPLLSAPSLALSYLVSDTEFNKDRDGKRDLETAIDRADESRYFSWSDPGSIANYFKLASAPYVGTTDVIAEKIKSAEASSKSRLHLEAITHNPHLDFNFSKTLNVEKLESPYPTYTNAVGTTFVRLPLELKIIGRFTPSSYTKALNAQVLPMVLKAGFAVEELVKLPVTDLLDSVKWNDRIPIQTRIAQKLKTSDRPEAYEIRLRLLQTLPYMFDSVPENHKKLAIELIGQEFLDLQIKAATAEHRRTLNYIREEIARNKIPLEVELTKKPGLDELLKDATTPREIDQIASSWQHREKKGEKIDAHAIVHAMAARLYQLEIPRFAGLTTSQLADLIWIESTWYTTFLKKEEILSMIERIKSIAMNSKPPKNALTMAELANALILNDNAPWKDLENSTNLFLELLRDLKPILTSQEERGSSEHGILADHHNLVGSTEVQENFKSLLMKSLNQTLTFDYSLDLFIESQHTHSYWNERIKNSLAKKYSEIPTPPTAEQLHDFGRWAFQFLNSLPVKGTTELENLVNRIAAGEPQNNEKGSATPSIFSMKYWKDRLSSWTGRSSAQESNQDFTNFRNMIHITKGWDEARASSPRGSVLDALVGSVSERNGRSLYSHFKVNATYRATNLATADLIELSTWTFRLEGDLRYHPMFASPENDKLIEALWNRRSDPQVANFLMKISAEQIHSPSLQDSVFDWKFQADPAVARLLKLKDQEKPTIQTIRPIVRGLFDLIQSNFIKSSTRDLIVHRWSQQLRMTPAELALLEPLLVSKDFAYQVLGKNIVQNFLRFLSASKEPKRNYEIIQMLLGEIPTSNGNERDVAKFQQLDSQAKTLVLIPLLESESHGALANPDTSESVLKLVLGELGNIPELLQLAKYYLDSLPANERSIIVARLLSVRQKNQPVHLSRMLDLVGPMGARSKQILRMLPILPAKYRDQLDSSFDMNQPPNRYEIITALKKYLGANFETHVRWVGELLGSGTLNYAVSLEILNPNTGKFELVVARLQKNNVGGFVENENIVLASTTEKCLGDSDAKVRRLGRVLDLVRSRVYSSLNSKDGYELDQKKERQFNAELRLLQGTRKEPMKLVEFSDSLLHLVSPEFHSQISFQPFIASISWSQLARGKKGRLAEVVVKSALQDIDNGLVDKDPSRGNVLVDRSQDSLLRIDTAQPLRLGPDEIRSLKTFTLLLMQSHSGPDANLQEYVLKHVHWIFDVPASFIVSADAKQQLSRVRWSANSNILERILAMAEAMESQERSGVILSIRTQIASFFELFLRIQSWKEFMPEKNFDRLMLKFFTSSSTKLGVVVNRGRNKLQEIFNQKEKSGTSGTKGLCQALFER